MLWLIVTNVIIQYVLYHKNNNTLALLLNVMGYNLEQYRIYGKHRQVELRYFVQSVYHIAEQSQSLIYRCSEKQVWNVLHTLHTDHSRIKKAKALSLSTIFSRTLFCSFAGPVIPTGLSCSRSLTHP